MKRILVCGGRDFDDRNLLFEVLDGVVKGKDDVEIVSGHAKGADTLAEEYAAENGIILSVFAPDWKKYGKAAGTMRNKDMLDYISEEEPVVVAFWNGKSKGTENSIETARKMGIEPIIISY